MRPGIYNFLLIIYTPHGIPHGLPQFLPPLNGHPVRHANGGYPPWLRDDDVAVGATAALQVVVQDELAHLQKKNMYQKYLRQAIRSVRINKTNKQTSVRIIILI